MGRVPLTPLAPPAGVIETICRATAGCSGLIPFAGPSDDTSEAWLPGDANATIIIPAARTSVAPLALNDFQVLLGAELSLPADNDCCLRNHPDPDTVPSPHAISQFDKNSGLNPVQARQDGHSPLLTDAHAREKVAGVRLVPPATGSGPSPASAALQSVVR